MDIETFDLNLLRVLDALLREQHVSRAARRLNLSQPATSAALARLRRSLGDPLLVRTATGMRPTERAAALAPQLRALLQGVSEVLAPSASFEPKSAEQAFVIAATDYAIELLAAPLARRLLDEAPQARLAWLPVQGTPWARRLEQGEIDVAITNTERAPEALRHRVLWRDHFVGIASKAMARRLRNLSLDAFCALPQVLVSPVGDEPFRGGMDRLLGERGLARRVVASVPQFRFAVDLVREGRLVAVFPARLARKFGNAVATFALPLAPPAFSIGMSWHERAHRSAPGQWLRQTVRDALAESDDLPLPSVTGRSSR